MIRSFRDKEAKRIYQRERSPSVPPNLQRVALRKLRMLDAAQNLGDLRIPPGNQLEPLKGDRKGQHSIHINDQYRVCSEWRDGHAYEVEIVDYHRKRRSR